MGRRGAAVIQSLRVRGPFRGLTGYDHHLREFVRELVRQGVAVQLLELPGWTPDRFPHDLLDPWFDRLARPVDARVTLHFTLPDQVVSDGRTLDVNFTMFEATRAPASWIEQNRQHALVILPAESSRSAWLAAGFPPEKIQLCPLGIDAALYAEPAEPLDLRTAGGGSPNDYRRRFLNVSELGPRKNLMGLLTAWLRGTRADDNAILIIKLRSGLPGWLDRFASEVRDLERSTGVRFREAAAVEFLFDVLSDGEMRRLYAAATHYISLSHGEGWDQPMFEAAAAGLRLIAPDHTGYRAYLSPATATLIPSREVPAGIEHDPGLQALFAGAYWWEPDIDAAAEAIRSAIVGRDADQVGARDLILARYTWQQATRQLIEILSEVELSARR